MNLILLTREEQRTLRDMGIFHDHPRTRLRAQAILRLSEGLTLQQTADEFAVHLNSVEKWRQRWKKFGLVGLYEGHHSGRPEKWKAPEQQKLYELAAAQGGSAGTLLKQMQQQQESANISEDTVRRYLRQMNLRYKRTRYSLKKT